MSKAVAVLIDTVSIQKYVFASNRLKDNLGASYIVENIFDEDLKVALKQTIGKDFNINSWKDKPDKTLMMENPDIEFETGYIGGGNGLFFFCNKKVATQFIKNWSKRLLVYAPGLLTAVAMEEIEPKEIEGNLDFLERLYLQLIENKNKFFPNTALAKYGITADCPLSGLSAEIYSPDEKKYISSVSNAKLKASRKSQLNLINGYKDILANQYTFTNDLDKLGQKDGKNHLATVHIDGNAMGKRFQSCTSLSEKRRLSISVDNATQKAFRELVGYIVQNMDYFLDNDFSISKDNEKWVLPLRPIVLGGDDVTFISEGRVGVHFAEKFMEFVTKEDLSDGQSLTVCAGVTITKTKYPFYRAYKLSEELCSSAKKEARKAEGTSWMDFYIAYGGFSGSLAQIRNKHWQVKEGSLHFGPYVLNRAKEEEKSIANLKNGMKALGGKEKWPRSKVKELRSVLPLGKNAAKKFINDMRLRGLVLPEIGQGNYSSEGWENGKTPYLEMIELMELYPEKFLGGDE